MIIYNVSVKINPEIQSDWINWMRTHHIPKVLATGCFLKSRMSKLEIQEQDGITYIIQYELLNSDLLNQYMIHYAPALQKEHIDRYANKFVAFRTILDVLEEFYPTERNS